MVNTLAASQTRQNLLLLSVQLRGNDAGDWLPDHLVRLIPENVGRAGIPGGDDSIERLADDSVIGRGDDGRQARRLNARLVLLGDIHEKVDGAGQPAFAVPQRGGLGKEPHPGSVRPSGNSFNAADRPAWFED